MNKKYRNIIIASIVALIVILVVIFSIPSKEDNILKLIENKQYQEAISYISQVDYTVPDKESKNVLKIKSALLSAYPNLRDGLISDSTSYDTAKNSYILGQTLFPYEIKHDSSSIALNKTLNIQKEKNSIYSLIESKKYSAAFEKIASSPYCKDDEFNTEITPLLKNLDKEEVFLEAEKYVDSIITSSSGAFAKAPAFLTIESSIISEFLSDSQAKSLVNKINTSNKQKTCSISGCNEIKFTSSQYCSKHICSKENCSNYAKDNYCSSHQCKASGCSYAHIDSGSYCSYHTCSASSCSNYAKNNYCSSHKCVKSDCNYQRESGSSYCSSHQPKKSTSSTSYSGSFTNKYGTPSTRCAYSGCYNKIASSGDTNCCVSHSNRCGNCRCYIDGDALYCMSCLISAF